MRPVTTANIGFFACWFLAALWCRANSFDDPSSIFFKPQYAYSHRYSALRSEQADDFLRVQILKTLALNTQDDNVRPNTSETTLCIGIPSINRDTDAYLAHTVASLLDTLSIKERNSVHLAVLLADPKPSTHIAYRQQWLSDLADEIIVYGSKNNPQSDPAKYKTIPHNGRKDGHPRGTDRIESMRLDIAVLAESCRSADAKYFALVEDDVLASSDWFSKFKEGVARIEQDAKRAGTDWLYMRLFYSELYLYWTWKDSISFAKTIFFLYIAVTCVLMELRRRRRIRFENDRRAEKSSFFGSAQVFNQVCTHAVGVWVPATIVLYLVSGRQIAHRLSMFSTDVVREMPSHGCCGQGLVFPQHHLAEVDEVLRNPPFELAADRALERYADAMHLQKWTLSDSVLQHVGPGDSEGLRQATYTWNFGFERRRNPAPVLRY